MLTLAVVFPAFLLALVPYVLPYVGPALAAVTLAAFGFAVRLVLAHVKASRARHYTLALLEAAHLGVLAVEQSVAPALRGPDGKLSPNAGTAAKAAALTAALDWLRLQGLASVKAALGLTDEELAQRLGVAIEATVAQMPASVAPVASTPKELVPLAQGGNGTPHNLVRPVASPAGI